MAERQPEQNMRFRKRRVDVVLISDGRRPRLKLQTMWSLRMNALSAINLHLEQSRGRGVGETKNSGAQAITRMSDYVLFSDDDMYWLPGWDMWMASVMCNCPGVTQLGAWSHPFNLVTDIGLPEHSAQHHTMRTGRVNACHGGGFIMRWTDWDRFEGFADNALGPGQSEDWDLSQRIIKAGGRVRCIVPFAALHCGITNCLGEPATGGEEIRRELEATIRKLGLEDEVIYG